MLEHDFVQILCSRGCSTNIFVMNSLKKEEEKLFSKREVHDRPKSKKKRDLIKGKFFFGAGFDDHATFIEKEHNNDNVDNRHRESLLQGGYPG